MIYWSAGPGKHFREFLALKLKTNLRLMSQQSDSSGPGPKSHTVMAQRSLCAGVFTLFWTQVSHSDGTAFTLCWCVHFVLDQSFTQGWDSVYFVLVCSLCPGPGPKSHTVMDSVHFVLVHSLCTGAFTLSWTQVSHSDGQRSLCPGAFTLSWCIHFVLDPSLTQ